MAARRTDIPSYEQIMNTTSRTANVSGGIEAGNVPTGGQSSGNRNPEDLPPPPAYVHTVYDETYRAIWHTNLSIMSMANSPNLLGHLEYHAPQTDGSFAIAVATGQGVFVKKALWESIPKDHRPTLEESDAGLEVETLMGETMTTVGSVAFPLLLTNLHTGERMRYVLRAYVLPNLYLPMFISFGGGGVVETISGDRNGWTFKFKCGDGTCFVKGLPAHF